MARTRADDQIRDTNTHNYDNKHLVETEKSVLQYVNNLDAAVDIVVKGTYEGDDSFNDTVTLRSSFTVSAGSTERDSFTEPWDRVRFEVTAQSTPSSGSLVIKEHQ